MFCFNLYKVVNKKLSYKKYKSLKISTEAIMKIQKC